MSRNISAVSCLPNPYSELLHGLVQSIPNTYPNPSGQARYIGKPPGQGNRVIQSLWHNLTLAPFQFRHPPATIFLLFGSRLTGSFPGQPVPTRKWDRKTYLLKTAGPVPLRSRGDKTATKRDMAATKRTMTRQSATKQPTAPRSNVAFCRIFSVFRPPLVSNPSRATAPS